MADIRRWARKSEDGREAGGVLLGFDATDDHPLTVTVAGDAGPKAVRSTSGFRRDLEHAQRLADAAWACDGSVWVGDWHTHPAGWPAPSRTDLAGYRGVLVAGVMPIFLSLILSPGVPGGWEQPQLGVWLVGPDHVEAVELAQHHSTDSLQVIGPQA